LAVLFALGCERPVASLDAQERNRSLLKRAAAKVANDEYPAAIRLYRQALDADPTLGRAHLDLALVLDGRGEDLVGAIYHYRRYLQLRPATEKAEMLRGRIQRAEQTYAAQILKLKEDQQAGESPEDRQMKEALQALRGRVAALQRENSRLRMEAGRRRASTAGRTGAPRTYTVKRGDTLSSIALEMYDDSQEWQKILDANRNRLPDLNRLQPGQVLEIP
jgi:nucleoid-associated protein YgaU